MADVRRGDLNDFSSESVPAAARRPWWNVLFVWMGFLIVVGIMGVGGGLASQINADGFYLALIVGNVVLGLFAGVAGYVGAESGLSFNRIMAKAFPGVSWRIVSLYVPVVLIGWFGVEAAIFGGFVAELLGGEIWLQRLLMAASAVFFAISAYIGFKALRWLSLVLVPIILGLGTVALVYVWNQGSLNFGFAEQQLGLDAAIALVIGTWIMGALTCVPDITRFSKSPWSGAAVAFLGVLVGNGFTLLIGGVGAGLVGESDPAKILASVGAVWLALILSFANIWTTNDNNMYSAALNVSQMVGLTRRKAVLLCMLIGAIFAAFNPARMGFLFPFLAFLGNTAPALGGAVLACYFGQRFGLRTDKPFGGWLGWIAGSAVAYQVGGTAGVFAGFFGGCIGWLIVALVRR